MSSRFGSWVLNNEEIRNKVISVGPINVEGSVFVFGPLVNKYPDVEHTLGTFLVWVRISNIPRLYLNVEGLTYTVEALVTIVRKDVGFTWWIATE